MTGTAIGILLTALCASVVGAQSVARCPATTDSIARPCELDTWSAVGTSRVPPRYPDIMRQAGVETEARVEFVVDSSGRPDLTTVRIRAGHELFASMIKAALARTRFEPPRRDGLPVKVLVNEVVEFRHAGGVNLHLVSERSPSSVGVDSTGMLRTVVSAYVPPDSAAAPRLSDDERWNVYQVVAEHLMQNEQRRPSGFCIRVNREPPPARFFRRWSAAKEVVVPYDRCPRTYTSMIASPDTRRAPPGWVDLVHIDMDALRPWARNVVILDVQYSQGTITHQYQCEVVRTADEWDAGCIHIRTLIS